jgi:predicted component of type VI protein secretion system
VSKLHAHIEPRDDKFFVRDLDSSNGTRVTGVLLQPRERLELASGDRVRFGRLELRVVPAGEFWSELRGVKERRPLLSRLSMANWAADGIVTPMTPA